MRRSWSFLLTLSFGCALRPAPPLPTPPPIQVPNGCLESLAGQWLHEDDASYRYSIEDDGGLALFLAHRQSITDGGFRPRRFSQQRDAGDGAELADGGAADGGAADGASSASSVPATIALQRTPQGFVGWTRSPVQHPSGRWCQARFRTEVLSCGDGGLTLRSEAGGTLGDTCEPPPNPAPEPSLVHRLRRAQFPPRP
jgi:hypothetical protein